MQRLHQGLSGTREKDKIALDGCVGQLLARTFVPGLPLSVRFVCTCLNLSCSIVYCRKVSTSHFHGGLDRLLPPILCFSQASQNPFLCRFMSFRLSGLDHQFNFPSLFFPAGLFRVRPSLLLFSASPSHGSIPLILLVSSNSRPLSYLSVNISHN